VKRSVKEFGMKREKKQIEVKESGIKGGGDSRYNEGTTKENK